MEATAPATLTFMADPTDSSPPTTAPPEELSEAELLRLHAEGGRGAFRRFLEAWRRPVFSHLVRCGVPAADRDDLFQDIFLRIHRAANRYDPARPLRPWVFTIVANTVRNYFRDMGDPGLSLDGGGPLPLASPRPGPRRVLEARERRRAVEEALGCLPLDQRQALLLCAVEGMKQKEAAAILEVPVNTVKTWVRRARLVLARELAEADRRPPKGESP